MTATDTPSQTPPMSARPLACLRIGLAAVLLVQAYHLAGSVLELHGRHGLVQWSLEIVDTPAGVPRLSWAVDVLAPLGVSAAGTVRLVFLLYVASLVCLLAGWHTRLAALGAWLTHLALKESGNACTYGVDELAHIGLFYCLCLPAGHALALDRLRARVHAAPPASARLGLRVLQVHLCVVYLASGLLKAQGEQWWNGEAIWRAVLRPDFAQFDLTWLAEVPWLAQVLAWGTLLLEIGYPVGVWWRPTRRLWVLGTIGLHVGIAVCLGLESFAAVMIVLNLAAFLVPAGPARATGSTPGRTPPTRTPCECLVSDASQKRSEADASAKRR